MTQGAQAVQKSNPITHSTIPSNFAASLGAEAQERPTRYQFPDGPTLAKYHALLAAVILEVRDIAPMPDTPPRQVAALMNAVHNVPDLLCRWPDMSERRVFAALLAVERRYYGGRPRFSRILREGPPADWQWRWLSEQDN